MKKMIIFLAVSFCVTLTACTQNAQDLSSSHIIEESSASRVAEITTEFRSETTTIEPTTVEPTTIEPTTEAPTEPSTQPMNYIESGMWVKYSPQAAIFETYIFSDGIIERKEYSYENGSITEFNSDYTYAFMTYKIDGDSITIRDDKSREWTYYLSEDSNILERTYQDTMGTDTFTVTERMYHHDTFPSYETVIDQSKKRG